MGLSLPLLAVNLFAYSLSMFTTPSGLKSFFVTRKRYRAVFPQLGRSFPSSRPQSSIRYSASCASRLPPNSTSVDLAGLPSIGFFRDWRKGQKRLRSEYDSWCERGIRNLSRYAKMSYWGGTPHTPDFRSSNQCSIVHM